MLKLDADIFQKENQWQLVVCDLFYHLSIIISAILSILRAIQNGKSKNHV
jgi:hypothetical protein